MNIKILPTEKFINLNDLSLIATLRFFGIVEKDISRIDSRKIIFVFGNTKEVNEIINKFYTDDLVVSPQGYFLCLKAVKNRIYAQE